MKYGLTLPIFNHLADPEILADLAAEAEASGWDGVFVWDHVYYRDPVTHVTDPWIALAAVALRTSRVAIGPMVTPLARRRPHVLARQVAALDHLSHGRMILGVGLGLDASGGEFSKFGETPTVKQRAATYDEALGLISALLAGDRVDHAGEYFTAADVQFLPTPAQPHLPVWVAARWPNRPPLARAARYDGVFVIDIDPGDLAEAVSYIESVRESNEPFDVVVHVRAGVDDFDPPRWSAAGATWLLATFDPFTVTPDDVRAQITRRQLF